MISRPVLFNSAMVRAILDGRKTQTRRGLDRGRFDARGQFSGWASPGVAQFCDSIPDDPCPIEVSCPFGAPGDRLWVRETWAPYPDPHDAPSARPLVAYRSTDEAQTSGVRWRPSIHMPRWASRITLGVTGVRVERLQDISEADAMAEGARRWDELPSIHPYGQDDRWSMETPTSTEECLGTARTAFANYWNRCAGGERWNLRPESEWPWTLNPWVWVVEFRTVTP